MPAVINPNGLIKNNSYFRPCKTRFDTHGFRDGDIIKFENYLYMVVARQYLETRTALHVKTWGDKIGNRKSISSNKAKLIKELDLAKEIIL